MNSYYVYILASQRRGTLYIGITSDLIKRIWEHKNKVIDGFTKTYNVEKLVYYEIYNEVQEAILREKRLKKWNRQWKIETIEKRTLIGMIFMKLLFNLLFLWIPDKSLTGFFEDDIIENRSF